MNNYLSIFLLSLFLNCCTIIKNDNYEICRFYLTTHSGGHLGMTQIYNNGTIQVSTGWQEGLYGDTLLHLLFNKASVNNFNVDLFNDYYEQEEGKLSNLELKRIKSMLSDVSNEKYVIQETKDDVYFAWIGVIIAGEKEWSFYDDDIDDKMKILFDYLREISSKVLETKTKAGNTTYPFFQPMSSSAPKDL